MLKRKAAPAPAGGPTDDPRWYKDAVIYELRVRSFNDSNGDGIGDLPGLTQKLDYLQDLGVTAVWLLPICPSPMRDDGYDISDYTDVQAEIGTLDDFRTFVGEAHGRNLRVITELVVNHTSDQHPWFQRARRAPVGSSERDFYTWRDSPDHYRDARIIFKDFETSNWAWDPLAKAYYFHRFYSHQPDLNFRNPAVHQAVLDVVDFWFEAGVDGLRLDAVPYLYEEEGTSCENLPDTHAFLRELRRHVDGKFRNRMLLAEANQWPEDAARYFGEGDECHMNFHFPIMPRLFMSTDMEDRFPIVDILAQTPSLPESCQWALFLRNHDELTLEMVTDEERDYMYRAFAHDPTMRINLGIRRRLAPLVGNNRRRVELMNGLLASLPGTPVIYYGDEIGMGDNVYLGDRNGVRTPMQWSADRNAGFSRSNPQKLILPVNIDPEYHYESLNVEAQQNNTNSLLWWMKRLLDLRKRFHAFGRGTLEILTPENHRVLAFIRQFEDETILVVANLSRFIQFVELDLSRMKGSVPLELFGRTEFPPIGELPYLLTLGGHAFYWFSVEKPHAPVNLAREHAYVAPSLQLTGEPEAILQSDDIARLEAILPDYLLGRRWYEGRERELAGVRVVDVFPLQAGRAVQVAVLRADYEEGSAEHYVAPLAIVTGAAAADLRARAPHAIVAQLRKAGRADEALLIDALADGQQARELLEAMAGRVRRQGRSGALTANADAGVSSSRAEGVPLDVKWLRTEHGRAALAYDESYLLKFFRRLGDGTSPELEIGRFLGENRLAAPVPAVVGSIEYRRQRDEPITLATLHSYVPHDGDAWTYTCRDLGRFYERALTGQIDCPPPADAPLLTLALDALPPAVEQNIGGYVEMVRLMAERLAQLHTALGAVDTAGFAPEPYSGLDQRSFYQSMRNLAGRVLRELRHREPRFEAETARLARTVVAQHAAIYARWEPLLQGRLSAQRLRCHGALTLGKLLFTGKDFVIIDFEGDGHRPLVDRRRKRSPLRDVATLMRSLDHAAEHVVGDPAVVRESDLGMIHRWASLWSRWTGVAFLGRYLREMEPTGFLGRTQGEHALLLNVSLLEVALEEVGRALAEQDGRLAFALQHLLRLVEP